MVTLQLLPQINHQLMWVVCYVNTAQSHRDYQTKMNEPSGTSYQFCHHKQNSRKPWLLIWWQSLDVRLKFWISKCANQRKKLFDHKIRLKAWFCSRKQWQPCFLTALSLSACNMSFGQYNALVTKRQLLVSLLAILESIRSNGKA